MNFIIIVGDVANTLLSLSEKDFKERFNKEKPSKNTKIILSCRSGKRSGMVQEEIQKLGYEKYIILQKYIYTCFKHVLIKPIYLYFSAYNYVGGWLDWESNQKV